eukprot:8958190-Alexandrium_andersonii.AAC.1
MTAGGWEGRAEEAISVWDSSVNLQSPVALASEWYLPIQGWDVESPPTPEERTLSLSLSLHRHWGK